MTKYHPNFVTYESGNKLYRGKDLIIKIDGEPLYILGRLFALKRFRRKKLIQIEQTGSANNPKKDQIKFEMLRHTKGVDGAIPTGKYRVSCYAYFPGIGGKRWGDNFEIII